MKMLEWMQPSIVFLVCFSRYHFTSSPEFTEAIIMKQKLSLFLALLLALSLVSCGSSSSTSSYDTAYSVASSEAAPESEEFYDGSDYSSESSTLYESEDVKLIRNADLSMEATDLDEACANLEALVNRLGGYLEYSDVYQGGYSGSSYRYANYTARIPKEEYDTFLGSLSDDSICHMVNKSESTKNVGQQYADIESHIEMLNTKLTRLNELLAQAENMEDIITLEDAITETEYDLAYYTSSRNSYDNLINYSTFTITIDEVTVLTQVAQPTFGSRMKTALVSGFQSFGVGCQELLIFLTGQIPSLLVLAILVVVIVTLVRRNKRKKAQRRMPPPPPQTNIPTK
jgi:hypothetical protein